MARKKTAMTPDQEADVWRRYRLSVAFASAEPIEIDGVTFDLSCELDRTQWQPIAPLGTYSYEGARFRPRLYLGRPLAL